LHACHVGLQLLVIHSALLATFLRYDIEDVETRAVTILVLEGLAGELTINLQFGLRRLRTEQEAQACAAALLLIRSADSDVVAHFEAARVSVVLLSLRGTSRLLH
jgi:hypothetical protein